MAFFDEAYRSEIINDYKDLFESNIVSLAHINDGRFAACIWNPSLLAPSHCSQVVDLVFDPRFTVLRVYFTSFNSFVRLSNMSIQPSFSSIEDGTPVELYIRCANRVLQNATLFHMLLEPEFYRKRGPMLVK